MATNDITVGFLGNAATNYVYQTGRVSKRTTRTSETYDENGKLVSKETTVEEEFTPQTWVQPGPYWWQNPVSYTQDSNTGQLKNHGFIDDRHNHQDRFGGG